MANTQVVPNKTEMKAYLNKGMTQAQIAEAWGEKTGSKPSRSAIAMAITRYGLQSSKPRPRHDDLLPWRVKSEHKDHYDARMLRREGRRRKGMRLTESELKELSAWRRLLDESEAVVWYDPDTTEGFFWIRRESYHVDIIERPGDDISEKTPA